MATQRIPASIRWPDPLTGPFTVRLHFERIGGREECVGFELWGGTPPDSRAGGPDPLPARPLRATDVRRPPFAELVDASRKAAADHARRLLDSEAPRNELDDIAPLGAALRRHLEDRVKSFGDGSAGGRPPTYPPDHYAEVARVYRAAWAENGRPLVAISERWNVSKSAAGKWAARCREMGLLPRTSRGVPRVEEGQ